MSDCAVKQFTFGGNWPRVVVPVNVAVFANTALASSPKTFILNLIL